MDHVEKEEKEKSNRTVSDLRFLLSPSLEYSPSSSVSPVFPSKERLLNYDKLGWNSPNDEENLPSRSRLLETGITPLSLSLSSSPGLTQQTRLLVPLLLR